MLNFKSKSWLEQYLAYRQDKPLMPKVPVELPEALIQHGERFESLHHPLYLCMQRSGISFGFPVAYPFEATDGRIQRMKRPDLAKFILLDTLLYTALLIEGQPTGQAYKDMVARFGRTLRQYYQQLHGRGAGQTHNFVEEILFERVQYKRSYFDFRRSGINSHLFWDIYGFQRYYEKQLSGEPSAEWAAALQEELKALKILTLKVIAAAVHADWEVTRQEKFLLRQFRKSARILTPGEQHAIRNLIRSGPSAWDIQVPENLHWAGRRFLLDIALMGVYADAEIDLQEIHLLEELAFRLRLTEDDLISSKANLGLFLFQYGEQLRFYKARKAGMYLVWEAVAENTLKLGRAAKMEAVETREMAITLSRLLRRKFRPHGDTPLPSEQEIKAAIEQLKDLPRFLPFFSLIFMPVPGITELYIVTALSLERFSKGKISLLPSQLRQLSKREEEE
ncbi:MAG: TerB family tellurite resistance protein [Phaeodactylibacter xiamenensis]|uniref:TerB family tellurite resistance protein n=1 Tax=Phaeodactylibacter xiamenensis TaxID=1524460 RepID=A0A098S8S3_9BACT|nr:TerB family tellurite resistance protein [Phaeodactylibacter xiamenensis]KGE87482.1 hypothetical protein IX84_14820 [Phaeodactylibacter xiamenensis]MCR9054691.1 TerB family tellurite resistance protein [bacterium]